MRGISLGLYPDGSHDEAAQGARFAPMIDEIAAMGASHIALVVTWAQDDVRASSLAPGRETIADGILRRAIDRAHERGLKVLVFPIVTVRALGDGQWRGTLQPADIDAWWSSYERFILHYGAIAADTGTAALLIGSELGTTEAWQYRWYHLISRVRRIYGGALIYSANWDHYQHVSFWQRVDAVGISAYFELTQDRDATAAELTRAWRRVRDTLLSFAAAQGKPVWVTEVGYTSIDGTATRPWDYHMQGRLDHEEQRRSYQAFIEAWSGQASLGAVFFWNWYGEGGARDRGYTPKGKPAEAVLRTWYRAAER